MELKTQIQLVILIPILLILLLADFQVAMLGFLSIPSFQDSLLEFHINRHLNGLIIETNILQQEIFIQYQSYFNQIFGITAHLRYYAFGDFQNESSWSVDISLLNTQNFLSESSSDLNYNYTIDWYHHNYTSLEEMESHNPQEYFKLVKAVQSIGLADIVINNSRTLLDDLEMDEATRQKLKAEKVDQQFVPINYEYIEVFCSDSLTVRYPRLSKDQIQILEKDLTPYYNNSIFQAADVHSENTLNFTLSYSKENAFSENNGILITQHINTGRNLFGQLIDPTTNVQCYMRVKVLNNYLEYINGRHLIQKDDYELENDLFISLMNENKVTQIPIEYNNRSMPSSLFNYIINQTSLKVDSATEKIQTAILNDSLNELIQTLQNNSTAEKQLIYHFNGYDAYILLAIVDIKSTKKVRISSMIVS